ncbi:MAG: CapA family protein [Acidimicrobiia bacterium]|nr:CapA family protein [Acidimicrobiia bacterium]MYC86409.1 CapA family protein [Acidimicrobiia bacterium]
MSRVNKLQIAVLVLWVVMGAAACGSSSAAADRSGNTESASVVPVEQAGPASVVAGDTGTDAPVVTTSLPAPPPTPAVSSTSPAAGATTTASSTTSPSMTLPTTTSTTLQSETTTTATTAMPPARPRETLIIHGIGDVALDPVYVPTFPSEGYAYAWSGLDGIFRRDDLTVINMECVVSDLGVPEPRAFNFRCDKAALPAALEAGIDVASQANNHSLDFGREALVDSVANLRAAGIHPVGAGSDYGEAYSPALLEIRGWKIAVLGFGGVLLSRSWLATDDRPGIASGDDRADMVAAVERAAEIADLVIVTIHWGRELDTQPRPDDIAHAEAMVAAGADIIFGHHQHRVGPLSEIDGKIVAWGLGHIIWPRINPVSAQTTVAKVVVHPDGTMGACLMPAEIVRHGHPIFVGQTPGHCELLYGGRPSPMEPPSIMF